MRLARTFLVFSLMALAFLFFRGETVAQTLDVIGRICSGWNSRQLLNIAGSGLSLISFAVAALLLIFVQLVALIRARGSLRLRIAELPAWGRWCLYYAGAATVLLWGSATPRSFIYFGF